MKIEKQIKVLMIHDAWQTLTGGGQRHAQSLSLELEKLGVQIKHAGPWHHNIFIRLVWSILSPLWLWIKVKKQKILIIHAHGFHSVLTAKIISYIINVKIVHTVHGSHLMDQRKNNFKTKIENFLLTKIKVDQQWSVTKSFIKNYPNINKTKYIGNGVDTNIFKLEKSIRSDKPSIIWVGRNDWSKGLDIQKNIQEKLLTSQKEISIHTIIDGNLTQFELARKLQTAWLFLMTSRAEGLPLIILEAMACGLPIISTNVGEIPNIVNENNGRLFSPDEPQAAVNFILEIIEYPKLRNKLSINAVSIANNFTWNEIAHKIFKNYQNILLK